MTESFCNDKKCDCRRAFINVIYNNDIVATIGFGGEDIKFYEKWMEDKEFAKNVKGPILELRRVSTKYFEKYEGYISSHDYKRADDKVIAKLAKKISE